MKLPLKDYLKSFLASCLLGAIFITYMVLIGIPKTRAAGYYLLAKQEEGLGSLAEAEEYYKLSIESFTENYVLKEYQVFELKNK